MTQKRNTSLIRGIYRLLNIFYYLTAGLLILLAILAVYKGFTFGPKDALFDVTYKGASTTTVLLEVDQGDGEIEFGPGGIKFKANRSFLIITRIFEIGFLVLFFLVVCLLRKIFHGLVKEKNPFRKENPGRIRWIGYLIIIFSILSSFFDFYVWKYIARHISIKEVSFGYGVGFNLETIFLGLVVLVLSEIFRSGVQLQEDRDLTV
jgi:hypothetical protein